MKLSMIFCLPITKDNNRSLGTKSSSQNLKEKTSSRSKSMFWGLSRIYQFSNRNRCNAWWSESCSLGQSATLRALTFKELTIFAPLCCSCSYRSTFWKPMKRRRPFMWALKTGRMSRSTMSTKTGRSRRSMNLSTAVKSRTWWSSSRGKGFTT